MCAGLVTGAFEALRRVALSCPPNNAANITNEQLVRMVVRYVEDHPEDMHEDFIVPVGAILMATWPCGK